MPQTGAFVVVTLPGVPANPCGRIRHPGLDPAEGVLHHAAEASPKKTARFPASIRCDQVGLMSGDLSTNREAPIVV